MISQTIEPPAPGFPWTAADARAVDLIRVLAMDAVQQAGSGHPGTAMSLAPAACLLYQRILRHDPGDPKWPGRDRFVLSCGHSSLTLAPDDLRRGQPQVILIGTGSEVHIALAARDELRRQGIAARVVSMPCIEWFCEQDRAYRDEVLSPQVTARVSIEAGVGFGWRQIAGDLGEIISLEHFGAPAAYEKLYAEFGLTPERVVEAARLSMSRVAGKDAQ